MGTPFKKISSANSFRILYTDPHATQTCTHSLIHYLRHKSSFEEMVIVCIGTDRSTGDSLGPLVGSLLSKSTYTSMPRVYGTLDEPVHALNLASKMDEIHSKHRNGLIIAVDACLGQLKNVGCIQITEGSIKPGAGVNKDLPEVGHLSITGIVNVSGFMEYLVLQNTRLSIVMRMAEIIAKSVSQAYLSLQQEIAKGRN